jgi:hypothetical protein
MTASTVYTPVSLDVAHGLALEEDAARSAPPPTARQRYTALLRDLAAFMDEHEEFPEPYVHPDGMLHFTCGGGPGTRETLAALRRALGGKWTKDARDDGYIEIKGEWHGRRVLLSASREAVCRKVVTGTREVTEIVKDPAKLAEVPEIEVTRTEDIIEWVCEPVTAPARAAVAA